jgi:hypothetical protein
VSGLLLAVLLVLSMGSAAGAQGYTPSLSRAPDDTERLWRDGCVAFEVQTVPRDCVYGDRTSQYTVALVGDSHTSAIFPAVRKVARARHWKLFVYVKINCPFLDIPIDSAHDHEPYPQCAAWDGNVQAALLKLHPNLTITLPFRWIFPVNAAQATPAKEGAAIGRELAPLSGQKVIFVDTPWSDRDAPACLAAHAQSACAIPKSQVWSGGVETREGAAARTAGGSWIDLTSEICDVYPCPVVTDGIVMFRDNHHLTATYARWLAPMVDAALQKVIE